MIDKPGVYKISSEEYHTDPCSTPSLSRSTIIDLLDRSPAHAWFNHSRLNPDFKKNEDEKKFDLGQACHSLLLEGIDNAEVIEVEDWRTKAAKEARDQAREKGKIPLLLHQYDQVKEMVGLAMGQIRICEELGIIDLQGDGTSEMSYVWQEEDKNATGISPWLRVRPDWVSNDHKIILDYKTTGQSGNPSEIARYIINMRLDIQNALYVRGVKAIQGEEPKFIFLFQETDAPYLCSIVGLPPDFLEIAKQKVEYGIFLWQTCLAQNEWPGYPNRVAWIELPQWAFYAWEHKATELRIGT